jgi:hypothetical protein
MKKKLVASLAAAMVLGVAGTSFAATNPFTDVPAKHWSYDAVAKLANAGIVDGYGDGTFRGDKVMSRYEMAQIVAKAMAHSDKATAEQKASIDKLSVEFASELEGLNVRVTKLEKNSSTIKVTGETRIRWEDYDRSDAGLGGVSDWSMRNRVNLNGNINDDWTYYGRLQGYTNLRGDGKAENNGGGNNVTMDNAFIQGPLFGATATLGRFDYYMGHGLLIDSTLNGAQFAFGNKLKTKLFYGTENNTNVFHIDTAVDADGNYLSDYKARVAGANFVYGLSDKTNLNAGYYQFQDKEQAVAVGSIPDDKIGVWEAGFDTKLGSVWSLQGSYAKSDADTQNKAYFAQLGYKEADKTKAGTYGAWVGYRRLDSQAAPVTTFDGAYAFNAFEAGGKGYELGLGYVPMTNSLLTLKYSDLKPTIDGASDLKSKYYLAQLEVFF